MRVRSGLCWCIGTLRIRAKQFGERILYGMQSTSNRPGFPRETLHK